MTSVAALLPLTGTDPQSADPSSTKAWHRWTSGLLPANAAVRGPGVPFQETVGQVPLWSASNSDLNEQIMFSEIKLQHL